jgi:hypothetical protein
MTMETSGQKIMIAGGSNHISIDSRSTDGSVEFIHEISHKVESVSLMKIPPKEFHHARTRNYGAKFRTGSNMYPH